MIREPSLAEEVAIALALAMPEVSTVVTDSKKAYASYRKGIVSSAAATLLEKHPKTPGRVTELVWVPAHSLVEGNVTADHYARELAIRAEEEQPHPVTSYKEIVRLYKESRTRLPKPHKQLSRRQQTILRRLQAGSLAHPALLHKMYPAEHDNTCPFCRGDGTLAHIIGECKKLKTPPYTLPPSPNSNPLERWETLLSSSDLAIQQQLVARGEELLDTYGSRE